MPRRPWLLSSLLVGLSLPAGTAARVQSVEAPPSAQIQPIVGCVRAGACKGMRSASINWFDVVGIPVQTFTDGGWTYAVAVQSGSRSGRPDRLTIYFAPPGEPRPTEQLSLDLAGQLVTAELGPQPGERVPSRDPYSVWQQKHKAFATAEWHPSGKGVGEEFRSFWQQLADQALAAIARALTR